MSNINWIQVIIGFISGGAFGAVIKQFFDNRRNRIQPIGHAIDLKSFYNSGDNKLMTSEVILKDNEKEYKFSKLYTGTIEVLNSGLSDYSDFQFGITTSDKIKFIQVKPISSDRHHTAEVSQKPAPDNQVSSFDITLKPFNRKDKYSFDFLLTTTEPFVSVADLQISSSKPIKWVKLVSTTEILFDVANKTLLEIFTHRIFEIMRVYR